MQFRHLLLSLALALIVIGPLPARADAPAAKDVATIGDCLRKQDNKKGGSQEADEAARLLTVAKPCMGGDETGVSSMRQIECPGSRAAGLGQDHQRFLQDYDERARA